MRHFINLHSSAFIAISTTRFFYKNILYKNIHDEIGQKIKNMLRISPSWNLATGPKNAVLQSIFTCKLPIIPQKNVSISPKCQILASGMQLHVRFKFGLDPYLRIFLRTFQHDFSEKVKNIHDEMEKHHSYKKSVYLRLQVLTFI